MALGKALLQSGKLDEAERQYRAVTDLYPDFTEAKYQLAKVLIERGRLDKAEPWLRAVATAGDDPMPAFELAWIYWNLGFTAEADQVLKGVTGSPAKELADATVFGMRNDWAGMLAFGEAMRAKSPEPFWPTVVYQAAAMLGRDQEAIAALKKVRPDLFLPDATVSLLDLDMPILLAHLLRRQGATAQADRLLDQVLLATAPAPGRRTMNDWRIARAKVFAERGQNPQALAEIEAAVNAGWRTPFLFIDSVWIEDQPSLQGLRNNPRFKALMAKVRQDLTRQRAAVQLR
jgi:tetratricopeptide (TPR) repeat protein